MQASPQVMTVRCPPYGDGAGIDASSRAGAADTGDGRASLASLLVLFPIVLGVVLLAVPFLFGFHLWTGAAYVVGAGVCFVVAAIWLWQMRNSPCLSAF